MQSTMQFLRQSLLTVLVLFLPLIRPATAGAEAEIDLSPRLAAGRQQTISIELQLGGDLKFRSQATSLVAPDTAGSAPREMPVAVEAQLAYEERVLAMGDERRAVRFYHEVRADVTVGDRQTSPEVRPERRLVVAEVNEQGKQLAAVEGPLYRTELDSIELMADSLAIDALLPGDPQAVGDTWNHDLPAMRQFTGLDSIEVCEVSSVLVETNGKFAKCHMAGVMHGVVDGAATELELDGIYLVDLDRGQVAQLNLAVQENRSIGPARPGLAGVAKLKIKITPADRLTHLTPARANLAAKSPSDRARSLETRSDVLGFQVVHDPLWFDTGTRGDQMTLRRVETTGLVAHGNIARLAAKPIDPARALAEFRSDVVQAIGEPLKALVSEEQWTNQHGCRVMGVVATGEVAGQPIEWRSYLVAPAEGSAATHRLALTFTVLESERDRLAGRDRELVDRIELLPGEVHSAGRGKSQR